MQRKEGKVFKEIYKGFPADKAGLKAGDEIIQIGDINLKRIQRRRITIVRGAKTQKLKFNIFVKGKRKMQRLF